MAGKVDFEREPRSGARLPEHDTSEIIWTKYRMRRLRREKGSKVPLKPDNLVRLISPRETDYLGANIGRLWPQEATVNFDELLTAIDESDRAFRRKREANAHVPQVQR